MGKAARRNRRREIAIDGVFDIETEDWDTFVVGGLLLADGTYLERTWKREREFAEAILGTPGTLWAHNGGKFDCKWLLDWCLRLEVPAEVVPVGGAIIRLQAGETEILDSYALAKVSLAELSAGTGTEKADTGLPCVCGEHCGGYCSIKRAMSPELLAKLRRYLRRDCESLVVSLVNLQEWARKPEVDIDLGMTVGGSAFRNARRLLKLPDADLTGADHEFVRKGYFGGRVQVFKPRSSHGFEYDVASMYPSRLAYCPVPVGKHRKAVGRFAANCFDQKLPGFYRAQVAVEECHVPPLPIRVVKPTPRIAYPWGTFQGVWALPELEYAESIGVEVKPLEAIVWERSEILFSEWIERLFSLRRNAPGGKKGPIGTFVKFFLNSLTGKFGSRPEAWQVLTDPDDLIPCKCDSGKPCDGLCGGMHPLDDGGRIVEVGKWRIGPECHVEWAGWLTSAARVEWHRQAVSADGGADLVYCDTDSIYCEKERTRNLGSELGHWEYQGEYTQGVFRAPKVYSYRRAGRPQVKAKGLTLPPLKEWKKELAQAEKEKDEAEAARLKAVIDAKLIAAWRRIAAGEKMPSKGLIGFAKGAKDASFFKRESSGRRSSVGYGDRILDAGADRTRAPHISEITEQ